MPNPVVHFEVVGKDPIKLQEFYGKLFDWKINWKINNMAEMGNYGMVDAQDGHGIGGGVGGSQEGPGHVTFYVEVANPQAYIDKAVSLGGSQVMPQTDMGMVVFGLFTDPEGHMVGVVKSQNH